jgi:hypothetical protein
VIYALYLVLLRPEVIMIRSNGKERNVYDEHLKRSHLRNRR